MRRQSRWAIAPMAWECPRRRTRCLGRTETSRYASKMTFAALRASLNPLLVRVSVNDVWCRRVISLDVPFAVSTAWQSRAASCSLGRPVAKVIPDGEPPSRLRRFGGQGHRRSQVSANSPRRRARRSLGEGGPEEPIPTLSRTIHSQSALNSFQPAVSSHWPVPTRALSAAPHRRAARSCPSSP